jgi:hypothetical protein
MDTAPKDGQYILAHNKKAVVMVRWEPTFSCEWDYELDEPIYSGAWTDDTVLSWGCEENMSYTDLVAWMPIPPID